MDYPDGATPLEHEELEGLKFKNITTRSQLDHLEQANIESGIMWLQRSKKREIFTEEYIKILHQKLFGEVWRWAGKFRTSEKNIGVDPFHISTELKKLLDDTKYWIDHKTFLPFELAMKFHHRLVFIHPFANGNGRHARIMADAILTKIYQLPGLDWTGGHNLSDMNQRRVEYIKALRHADKNDFSLLLKMTKVNT
jgi:Fic-DOC domain mobile mystery protein B